MISSITCSRQRISILRIPGNDPDMLVYTIYNPDKFGLEQLIVDRIIDEIPEEEFVDFMVKVIPEKVRI